MKHLGIDYGKKNIGLAVSDDGGSMAFPYGVLPNDSKLVAKVGEICRAENVGKIIIGRSLTYAKEENPIMARAYEFGAELAKVTGLPVEYEDETLTSREAERIVGDDDNLDARAAALILRSYLEKNN